MMIVSHKKQVRNKNVGFKVEDHDQGSLHLQEPGRRTCRCRDSNPRRLHCGERYSKELSGNLSNNYSKNLHEASTWLPPRACVTLTHALHQDVGRIAQSVFLCGKTVPSRRGHHYGGTWPGPYSTGALGTVVHRSGFKPVQASILAKSYLESLVITNNYLQQVLEASITTFNDPLKICSMVLLGRRFSRRHSLILYF